MAGDPVDMSSQLWWLNGTNGTHGPNKTVTPTEELLNVVHFNYAWVLFVVFLTAFVTNSVLTAEPSSESKEPVLTGPGGKPLPRSARKYKEELQKRKKLKDFSPVRKALFLYLSAGILATFVANGANIVIHALTDDSEEGWWCGEATAVSSIRS